MACNYSNVVFSANIFQLYPLDIIHVMGSRIGIIESAYPTDTANCIVSEIVNYRVQFKN